MVLDIAQADPPVRLRHPAVDVHRRAPGGDAHMDAVRHIGVHTGDLGEGLLPRQMALLRLRMGPMAAQGEDQGDVLRPDAGAVQLLQQRGHHHPGGHGACDVAGDDGDLLPRADQVPQTRRADGRCQRLPHRRFPCHRGRDLVGFQHAQQRLLRDSHPLAPGTDLEFQFSLHSIFSFPRLPTGGHAAGQYAFPIHYTGIGMACQPVPAGKKVSPSP